MPMIVMTTRSSIKVKANFGIWDLGFGDLAGGQQGVSLKGKTMLSNPLYTARKMRHYFRGRHFWSTMP